MKNLMYERVITKKQQQTFEQLWEATTTRWSMPYNKGTGIEIRYLLLHNGVAVGTIEFVKFMNTQNHSIVEMYYPYSKDPFFAEKEPTTWEIGKLSIEEEYTSTGLLKNVFFVFQEHIREYGVMRYLISMEKKLFLLFSKFGLQFTPVSDEIPYPKTIAIPCYFEVDDLLYHPKIQWIFSKFGKQVTTI